MSGNEYWVIALPVGQRVRGEDVLAHMNRELTELVDRGWDVAGFERPNLIGPATFLLRRDK